MPQATQEAEVQYPDIGYSQSGGEGTDWIPLPNGRRFRFVIDDCKMKDPGERIGRDGKPQKHCLRAVYTLRVIDEDANPLIEKRKPHLKEGQEQSVTAWASFNYTLGTPDKASGLIEFIWSAGGFPVKTDLTTWLSKGGKFRPEWIKGFRFKGLVEHKAQEGRDKPWINVKVESSEEFEAANREILRKELDRANPDLMEKLLEEAGDDDDSIPF